MSRLGDLGRRVVDALVPPVNDLGELARIPGAHVDLPPDDVSERYSPYGATGTINQKGYLQPSEYNSDLQRFAALDVFERMRRSDPSVRETLWHIFGPVINAVWMVEPPDDPSDEEREHAAMAHSALFEWLEQPWVEVLEHALSYLTFGHSVFEPIWQGVERSLTMQQPTDAGTNDPDLTATDTPAPGGAANPPLPPDVETTVLPPRLFTTWRKFSPRLPRTLWQWQVDEFGELTEVVQTVWVNLPDGSQGYRVAPIPAEALMVFTHEKWGDEYTGISILRSAYKPWVMKEMIEKVASIAYERHGVGYLIGYIPKDKEQDSDLQTKIGNMLADLRADAYAVLPGPKQTSTNANGYLIEILSPTGGLPDFDPILKYYRSEIAGAMLTRFKELGHASTGARATADVQSAVWYNALHAVARYIESVFNREIKKLVDLNYPGVTRYPKLRASGIEARNLLEFAQAMALLVEAGLISTDTNTRAWARQIVDAPSEDLQESRAQAAFDAKKEAAAAQADLEGKKQLAQVQASLKPRGNETSSKENGGRPRVTNAEEE